MIRCTSLWILILISRFAFGAEPLRYASQLISAKPETLLHVSTASVVYMNEELLRRDFPEIRGLNHDQLKRWFLENAAVISKPQAAQEIANSKIHTDGERQGHRPPEYGRASIVEVSTGGLFDVKGAGVFEAPRTELDRNGLATLGSMIREYLYGQVASSIADLVAKFRRLGIHPELKEFDTNRDYGLINLGFWVKLGKDKSGQELVTPASILVRQVRNRYKEAVVGPDRLYSDPMLLPRDVQYGTERTLRAFGLSSTIRFRMPEGGYKISHPFDQLNVQGADDFAVIDFGSFWATARFELPVYHSYTMTGNATISEEDIAYPKDSPSFMQPKPELMIPISIWGDEFKRECQDNLECDARRVADAMGIAGKPDKALDLYRKYMGPVRAKFAGVSICDSMLRSPERPSPGSFDVFAP